MFLETCRYNMTRLFLNNSIILKLFLNRSVILRRLLRHGHGYLNDLFNGLLNNSLMMISSFSWGTWRHANFLTTREIAFFLKSICGHLAFIKGEPIRLEIPLRVCLPASTHQDKWMMFWSVRSGYCQWVHQNMSAWHETHLLLVFVKVYSVYKSRWTMKKL